MANICDQRITVVADTDADIVPVLEKMAENVLDGIVGDKYFTRAEYEGAKGDSATLYGLLKRCQGEMNLFCFFAHDPDTRTESGWMSWCIEEISGHPSFSVDIGSKWSGSYQPEEFFSQFDPKKVAAVISMGGEAYEWDSISIGDEWIEAADAADAIAAASERKWKVKSLKKIAYYENLSGIEADFYAEANEEW